MDAQLLPLPCACVIDADARLTYYVGTAACPWCSASFDVREWVAWLKSNSPPMCGIVPPRRAVLLVDNDAVELVVELVRREGGCSLVRECAGAEPFFIFDDADAQTLRN